MEFRIRAKNDEGWGEWSAVSDVSKIRLPPAALPKKPEYLFLDGNSVTITWEKANEANVDDQFKITNYQVQWQECMTRVDPVTNEVACPKINTAPRADECEDAAGDMLPGAELKVGCSEYFEYLYDIPGLKSDREYRIYVSGENNCGVEPIDKNDADTYLSINTATCPLQMSNVATSID